MFIPISQVDPRWKDVRIGKTNLRIGRWGCTICSLCMALGQLRGFFVNPADAARYWKFTSRGLIRWSTTKFRGMKFVKRGYYNNRIIIEKYANGLYRGEKTAVIAEVNNGKHWVYIEKIINGVICIADPIDGRQYIGLPSKYKITGYALFEAIPIS